MSARCADCGRPYGREHGFPDLVILNEAWKSIAPNADGTGLLCPSCICARLHKAGLKGVYGSFMSGPIRSVDEPTMYALRWTENLRELVNLWRLER
jgi:hypothetical protein